MFADVCCLQNLTWSPLFIHVSARCKGNSCCCLQVITSRYFKAHTPAPLTSIHGPWSKTCKEAGTIGTLACPSTKTTSWQNLPPKVFGLSPSIGCRGKNSKHLSPRVLGSTGGSDFAETTHGLASSEMTSLRYTWSDA